MDGVARVAALLRKGPHPAITHCDNCGCDWLDNGLNPIGCPYCKQPEAVDKAMVKRFTIAFQNTPGDEAIDANEKVVRRWLAAALDIQHQEPTT